MPSGPYPRRLLCHFTGEMAQHSNGLIPHSLQSSSFSKNQVFSKTSRSQTLTLYQLPSAWWFGLVAWIGAISHLPSTRTQGFKSPPIQATFFIGGYLILDFPKNSVFSYARCLKKPSHRPGKSPQAPPTPLDTPCLASARPRRPSTSTRLTRSEGGPERAEGQGPSSMDKILVGGKHDNECASICVCVYIYIYTIYVRLCIDFYVMYVCVCIYIYIYIMLLRAQHTHVPCT